MEREKKGEDEARWKGAGERNCDKVEPSIVERPSLRMETGGYKGGVTIVGRVGDTTVSLSLSSSLFHSLCQRNPSYFRYQGHKTKANRPSVVPLKIFYFDNSNRNSANVSGFFFSRNEIDTRVVCTCRLFLSGWFKRLVFFLRWVRCKIRMLKCLSDTMDTAV